MLLCILWSMNKDLWEDTEAKIYTYTSLNSETWIHFYKPLHRTIADTKTTAAVTFPAHICLVKKQLKMLSNISLRLSITVVEGCISPWKKKKQACGVQLNNKKWYNKQQHALRWINTSDMAADEAEPDKHQDRFQCGAV